jgi:bifunctional UDP-N-acetylglucosamine pyrophosphorylase/glucosamine-1-phosphate N-acetyltransferase
MTNGETAGIIFAAGKGSRMKGFQGNKTLLPLRPGPSPFEGTHPILLQILKNLPSGPRAVVVHHGKEDVIRATRGFGLTYCEQPTLNGTGGALLAAKGFLEALAQPHLIITMGDVPFVLRSTYRGLIRKLQESSLVILGFRAQDKKQYGLLEVRDGQVRRSIEWKYWSTFSSELQEQLRICNSGIYAARKDDLLRYLPRLQNRPHTVYKERNGNMVSLEEFFITDLVELMDGDGLNVGYVMTEEAEVMGVDDISALLEAQEIFRTMPNDP